MKNKLFKAGVFLAPILTFASCNNSMETHKNDLTPTKGYDLSLMDTTVSPCEDFYQYAIGGWMKNNPIPETESRWGIFNILSNENNEKMRVILEEDSDKEYKKGSYEQLTKDFYSSAMDTSARNSIGFDAIADILNSIDALENKEGLASLLGSLNEKGLVGLFSFYVYIDLKSSEENAVYVGQGGIGLPDIDYYLSNDEHYLEIKNAYRTYISNLLSIAGIEGHENYSEKIVELETRLAQISMSRKERRDPIKTYNKMLLSDFSEDNSYFNWSDFFENVGVKTSFDELIVSQPDFFKNLKNVIEDFDLDVWKAYIKWHTINGLAKYINNETERASFDFYQTTLSGTKEMKPLWERSVGTVNANMGQPLGHLFVNKHFSAESKERVSQMVEELRESFRERIKNLEWMSDETKEKAMVKLNSFGYKIGYPENWDDYSMVDINPNTLVQNVINTNIRENEMMLEKIGKPVDKTEWGMTPQTVNAYYSPTRNEIVFPAGILQPPFYDPNQDDALNYGGIGAVIGHEFSHGFDDQGSKYDGNGNMSNWWTDSDNENFKERTNKIVEQFNNFEVLDGVFLQGELTQGENIADFAGLTLAYYALKTHLENSESESDVEDGFTWQQRYFLGWARVWAQNITEQELRKRVITDPHSPGEFRVKGPLSNMPEFHEAFGCEPGSKMYSDSDVRVNIW